MGVRPKSIELHIEELILDGFEQGDKQRIAEAVERELTNLFAKKGIPASLTESNEIRHLDGGVFHAKPDSKPEIIGAKVAQAVYGGMKR
jgi:hypothetical protein